MNHLVFVEVNVRLYKFVPDCSNEQHSNNFTENNDFETIVDNRSFKLNWCQYGQCVVMRWIKKSSRCQESE